MKYNKTHILFSLFAFALALSFFNFRNVSANDTGVVNATVQLAICGDNVKDYGEQCDLGDFGGKTCTDFGYTGGTLGCSFSCQFDTSGCTTDATATATTTLSPLADRTYILPDDSHTAEIFLPESFHVNDLTLFLFSEPVTPTPPVGESLVGKLYNLIFVNENGDVIHQLQKSSTIKLSYLDTDLTSVAENTLAPYRSEDNGISWSAIPDYTLDPTHKIISFTTSEFSLFSIFGSPPEIHHTDSSSSGGGGGNWTLPKATADEKKKILKVADFNQDGVVNLSDLSILLYYYQHPEADITKYDLNADKKIDIVDISIMIYYWGVTS